ncbi:MAG: DUF418 domain-containing protein [Acidimicrobiales bacterium]
MAPPASRSASGSPTTVDAAAVPGPALGADRHGFVDALRGFALLGILLVNIEFIVQPSEVGWFDYTTGPNAAARWLVVALGQMKIYPLFALLFGYGLAVQLQRAKPGSDALDSRYRRRMIGLVILGVAHGVLFFPGDILVIYGVVGSLAYRLRHRSTKQLLRIAMWTYALASLAWLVLGLLEGLATDPADSAAPVASADALRILSEGTFVEVVVVNFFFWIVTLGILAIIQGPAVFASFLAGVALGRTTLLAQPEQHRSTAIRALRWMPLGLIGAGVGATLAITGGRWATLGLAVGFAAAPLVAAGYVGILALVLPRLRRVSAVLQASGRMSLTIYLLESIVATTLAYGYGFGLFGSVGPIGGIGLAVAIWLALSAFAVVWMRFARFGPFEWLLRSFTYGRWQPLRR